jgi:hypothetical protein
MTPGMINNNAHKKAKRKVRKDANMAVPKRLNPIKIVDIE